MFSRLRTSASASPPPFQVRVVAGDETATQAFTEPIQVGRDDTCDVQVPVPNVSRVHVATEWAEDTWWVVDQNSTNGLFADGMRVERVPVQESTEVQLGEDGPVVVFSAESSAPHAKPVLKKEAPQGRPSTASRDRTGHRDRASKTGPVPSQPKAVDTDKAVRPEAPADAPPSEAPGPKKSSTPAELTPAGPAAKADAAPSPDDASLSWYRRHYLTEAEDAEPAGERTRFIRQAYREVQTKQRRTYWGIGLGLAAVLVLVAAYAGYQQVQNQRLQAAAADLFYEMKEQDVRLTQLARIVEETGGEELTQLLEEMQASRQRMAQQYEGYVRELGVYRSLTDTERLIYRVARIFGESEFEIPAGFVRAVQQEIDSYWLASGRSRWLRAVRHAEEQGYTPVIVRTMLEHGLPPEMYYLALQESNLNVNAVGPETRWGIAKGMWQFIPSTGRAYGLRAGPREEMRVVDPQDDRHDFAKATVAAARYQAEIYSTLAQASGLLVLASYNWGENGVLRRLNQLFEGIPDNPRERSYWRFLQAYEDRMPQETKDYVLRIFAAAVIGQDPAHFGIDAENPLLPYLEEATELQAQASAPDASIRSSLQP